MGRKGGSTEEARKDIEEGLRDYRDRPVDVEKPEPVGPTQEFPVRETRTPRILDKEKYDAWKETQKPAFKIIRGKKFVRRPTGYTIREFFSHSTPEKGPGPGWDTRLKLERMGLDPWDTESLPDDPYFVYDPEEVEEGDENPWEGVSD